MTMASDPLVQPPADADQGETAPPTDADQCETQIRSNKALLALGRLVIGDDALTEENLVAILRSKLPSSKG